jgi:hypothetical protein
MSISIDNVFEVSVSSLVVVVDSNVLCFSAVIEIEVQILCTQLLVSPRE